MTRANAVLTVLGGSLFAFPVLLGYGAGLGARAAISPAPAVTASAQTDPLVVQVAALTAQVAKLTDRIGALEAAIGTGPTPTPQPAPTPVPPAPAPVDTDPRIVADYDNYLNSVEAAFAYLSVSVESVTFDQAVAVVKASNVAKHDKLLADLKDTAKASGVFNADGSYRDRPGAKALFGRFYRSAVAGRKGQP